MLVKKLFVLEDDDRRMLSLRQFLVDEFPEVDIQITHVDSTAGAVEFKPPYDLILLDHDLGGRQMDNTHEDNGLEFVKLIKDKVGFGEPILIHSYNPVGAERMKAELGTHKMSALAPFMGPTFQTLVKLFMGG